MSRVAEEGMLDRRDRGGKYFPVEHCVLISVAACHVGVCQVCADEEISRSQ